MTRSFFRSLTATPKPLEWLSILLRVLISGTLAGLMRLFFLWAGRNHGWVESVYSRGIYPWLSQSVSVLFRWLPFSAAEFILYFLSTALLVQIIVLLVHLIRRPYRLWRLCRWLSFLLAFFSIGYALFYSLWGLNYQRLPLSHTLGYMTAPADSETLARLCEDLVKKVNVTARKTKRNPDQTMALSSSLGETLQGTITAWDALGTEYPAFSGRWYSAPKPVTASGLLCYTEITGIFIPYTIEANVNVAVPYCTLPADAAHEAAHQHGFAREDEANYLSYRACIASGIPEYEYSGYYLACVHSLNALYKVDRQKWRKLYSSLCDEVRADMDYGRKFWKQYEGPVAEKSNQSNDAYLKSNQQSAGIQSYGRMVDLLIAEYRQKHDF